MIEPQHKILLVDDENDILEFVSYNLKKEGFDVFTAANGKDAIRVALEVRPQLIILDVMMPEMDGIETCEELRKLPELADSIIAFLTARGEDYSQIAGFEAGADDYIAKPIKPKVLVSRVKALLRRTGGSATDVNRGDSSIFIDKARYIVAKDNVEIELPKKEFELLALLHSKPHKVFTREEIFSSIWGDNVVVGDRTIDVHIRKLREKIGEEYIKTIKGVGYKYVD